MIQIGCCGFPKAKSIYGREFKLVEVQQTFYQPPKIGTALSWRDQVPEDFQFALKAWQLITHTPSSPTYRRLRVEIPEDKRDRYGSFRPTKEVLMAWNRTKKVAQALGAEVVLFQCPASFQPTKDNLVNMRVFFGAAQRERLTFAWEPRGPWSDQLIHDLCRDLNLIHATDPFVRPPQHGDFNYFRLHGIGGYRYRYRGQDLKNLLEMCSTKSRNLCLFNNVTMYRDALRFRNLVVSR